MLTIKQLRHNIRNNIPALGTWLQIPSSDTAEIIGRMGYDFATVDLEHASFTRANLPDIFRALESSGTLPFARVIEPTKFHIKEALDSGAQGVIFPMIETREQLDNAISWSLYPGGREFSKGTRGVGFSRANAFGKDFDTYVGSDGTGQEVVLVAQIESVHALPQLDAIFSHPRLDAFMVGPYDLSASMGLTGQFTHPEFQEILSFIEMKAAEHNVAKGYHVVQPDPEALKERIKSGYSFLAYGIDTLFLQLGQCPKI